MPEFDTIIGAINSYKTDHTIKALWYDDLKRKIVTREPHHSNKIFLASKDNNILPFAADLMEDILIKIANHHAAQYAENLIDEAYLEPISYDDLFDILNTDFRIFYDAALQIREWVFKDPEKFGLQKIMHHEKGLAFIPVKKAITPCLTV